MAGKIFINYRRQDSHGDARSIFQRLEQTFGKERILMDVDTIPAGSDFGETIKSQLDETEIFLALIGPNWLNSSDPSGARRLDDPSDFVRTEIAAALANDLKVIPVLLGPTLMPDAADLPDDLKPLTRRNAVRISHENFNTDMNRLEKAIPQSLFAEFFGSSRPRVIAVLLAVLGLIVGTYWIVSGLGLLTDRKSVQSGKSPADKFTQAQMNAINIKQTARKTRKDAGGGRTYTELTFSLIVTGNKADRIPGSILSHIQKVEYVFPERWYTPPVRTSYDVNTGFRYRINVWGSTPVTARIYLINPTKVLLRKGYMSLDPNKVVFFEPVD